MHDRLPYISAAAKIFSPLTLVGGSFGGDAVTEMLHSP